MPDLRSVTRHIPNVATSLNIVSGFFSILLCLEGNLVLASWFIFLAVLFDFSDGLLARLLKAYSDLGKQLDSLADIISFGVAPSLLFFRAYQISFEMKYGSFTFSGLQTLEKIMLLSTVLIVVTSALRLGKFNIDTEQKDEFIGLPTPATGIFIASYMLLILENIEDSMKDYLLHPVFLFFLTIMFSLLMISGIPMFSMKFQNYGWKENKLRYVFLGISIILVILIKLYAIPVIILSYIIVSSGRHLLKKFT